MYIKITKNAKEQAYYHLVESYRHNGKVKQRTLMSPGKADDNCIQINDLKGVTFGITIPVRNGKKRIWVRTDIRKNAVKVMKALNRKIPPKILKVEEEEAGK
jgi:hypothetical protein